MADPEEPDPKKQEEEEKKKSGAAWTGAKPPGGTLSGAPGSTAGAQTAARAVVGVGRAAGTPLGSLIARFLALPFALGKLGLAAGLAAAVGVGAMLAAGLAGGGGPAHPGQPGQPGRGLGAIASFKAKAAQVQNSPLLHDTINEMRTFFGASPSPRSDAAGASGSKGAFGTTVSSAKTRGVGPAEKLPGTESAEEKEKWKAPKLEGQMTGSRYGKSDMYSRAETIRFGATVAVQRSQTGGLGSGGALQMGKSSSQGGSGGTMVRSLRATNSTMSLGRHGMKSSRALAQLRSMGTLNSAIRSGGPRASEVQSAVGTAQFEGTRIAGGTTPPDASESAPASSEGGGGGGGASPPPAAPAAGPSESLPKTPDCGADAVPDFTTEPATCKPIKAPENKNVTPWQDEVDAGEGLLIAAGVLILVGGILMNASNSGGPFTQALKIAAFVLLGVGMGLAAAVLGLGIDIAVKGGTTQGTVMAIAGGVCIIEAGLAMANKISVTTLVIISALAVLVGIIGLALR